MKGVSNMELAKITSKGQITIPIAIRKHLGVEQGDKILFVQEGDKVILMNASIHAVLTAQKEFQGIADELNIHNEQDVVNMVKEIRSERNNSQP